MDLVNTLDERPFEAPVETLHAYGDLVRFVELAGLVEPSVAKPLRSLTGPASARVARRARRLRENLFMVLTAWHEGKSLAQTTLDAIALEVRRAHAARTFAATVQSGVITHCWVSPTAVDVPLHACALAVEALLVSADHNRIRKCGAHDCEVYFIDTSKARRRQWCSMQNCGNREKQKRWRQNQLE